jgi:hypothetical protein
MGEQCRSGPWRESEGPIAKVLIPIADIKRYQKEGSGLPMRVFLKRVSTMVALCMLWLVISELW